MKKAPYVDMTGKVVAITGANAGIGRATAEALARMGAMVLACGRNETRLEATAAAIRTSTNSDRVQTFVADLSSMVEVRGLAADIAEHTDRLDVLINNAGIGVMKCFLKGPEVGAQTSIYLASAPELKEVSGRYFHDFFNKTPSKLAQDEALAKRLWDATEALLAS